MNLGFGTQSRQVLVWRGLISTVSSVINTGPNNHYSIDGIPVCTGSGMHRLHCMPHIHMAIRNLGIGPLAPRCVFLFPQSGHKR